MIRNGTLPDKVQTFVTVTWATFEMLLSDFFGGKLKVDQEMIQMHDFSYFHLLPLFPPSLLLVLAPLKSASTDNIHPPPPLPPNPILSQSSAFTTPAWKFSCKTFSNILFSRCQHCQICVHSFSNIWLILSFKSELFGL